VDLPGDNTVFCDGRLFGIAIDNIVQNALRYSVDEGTIRVYRQGAEYVFENETDGLLPEKLEQLWEPFARGANAEEKSREGNGLGLSIVRRIFELNGFSCRIAVEGKKFILAFNTEK